MPDLFTVAKFPKYVGSVYATGGVGGGSRPRQELPMPEKIRLAIGRLPAIFRSLFLWAILCSVTGWVVGRSFLIAS